MDDPQTALALLQLMWATAAGLVGALIGAFAGLRKLRAEVTMLKAQNTKTQRELRDIERTPGRNLRVGITDDLPSDIEEAYARQLTHAHLPDHDPSEVLHVTLANNGDTPLLNLTPSIGEHRPDAYVPGKKPIDGTAADLKRTIDLGPEEQATFFFAFPDSYEQRDKFVVAFTDDYGKRWKKWKSGRLELESGTEEPLQEASRATGRITAVALTLGTALVLASLIWGSYDLLQVVLDK